MTIHSLVVRLRELSTHRLIQSRVSYGGRPPLKVNHSYFRELMNERRDRRDLRRGRGLPLPDMLYPTYAKMHHLCTTMNRVSQVPTCQSALILLINSHNRFDTTMNNHAHIPRMIIHSRQSLCHPPILNQHLLTKIVQCSDILTDTR